MLDPAATDGNHLGGEMGSRWHAVVVDATDPPRLARWWAEVLGLSLLAETPDGVTVGDRSGGQPVLLFTQAALPRAGRSRLQLDLAPEDRDGEVERLVDMGARFVDGGQTGAGWSMLADPEGNHFVLRPGSAPTGSDTLGR